MFMNDVETQPEVQTVDGKSNNKMIAVIIVIIALVGLGAFVLFGESKNSNTTSNTTMMDEKESATTSSPSSMEKTTTTNVDIASNGVIEVEGANFKFDPNEIRVKKGETVKIKLTSTDMMHDFVIDELDVKSTIAKTGETTMVEFTPNQVGEFEFYCSVGQHRKNGMFGTLIVTE